VPWVRYFSRKGNVWTIGETRFQAYPHDCVQELAVPELVLVGAREGYVFKVCLTIVKPWYM